MRLCYKLGIVAVVVLLCRISAYPASTRNGIDPHPAISLMRAEAPRCAVICGISCIRPWAPFNGTGFPMPDQGGLFECLRSGPVIPQPIRRIQQARLQAVQVERWLYPRCFAFVNGVRSGFFGVKSLPQNNSVAGPAYRLPPRRTCATQLNLQASGRTRRRPSVCHL